MHTTEEDLRISGIVAPHGWGDFHNIISVVIIADDHRSYIVSPSGLGRVLFQHVDSRITVTGHVWEGQGAWHILVKEMDPDT
jgi:hypothetical protein